MVRELWLIKQPEGPGMESSLLAKRKVVNQSINQSVNQLLYVSSPLYVYVLWL